VNIRCFECNALLEADDADVAVEEGDAGGAGRGVGVRGIVGHQTKVVGRGLDLSYVDGIDGPVLDRDLVDLARAVIGDRQCVLGHVFVSRLP
jgi:hypothetical protein